MEFPHAQTHAMNMEFPRNDDDAVVARIAALSFNEVRSALRSAHIRNSFKGANEHKLRQLLFLHHHNAVPAKYVCYNHASAAAAKDYSDMSNELSLRDLSRLIPDEMWAQYLEKGWMQYTLPLNAREKEMIKLVHELQLVELGVDSQDPSTYNVADGNAGIMRCVGCCAIQRSACCSWITKTTSRIVERALSCWLECIIPS